VPPLEAWEKVLVDGEEYPLTVHGILECTSCHGGRNVDEKEAAHQEMLMDPSEDPELTCGECHSDLAELQTHSLHSTLQGYRTSLYARSLPENHEKLEEMMGNHCDSCHATCGQCHVSQPTSVGGGLLDGHSFMRTPPMSRTCTACHGSRVGNEYTGKNEGYMADIHFRQGRMSCVDCHDNQEMHGQEADCQTCHEGPEPDGEMPLDNHRYDGRQSPRCETCHVEVAAGKDKITMHKTHGGDLSCQVCHSITYKSCDGCHPQLNEDGNAFFETDGSYMTFFIGLNPRPSYERPYKYVPVRHVPVAEDSFAFYGDDLLPNMDALPTWLYATPHNIQILTPQNATCNSCHGNPDIFLTADKVYDYELEANLEVIVDQIPEALP
jgi:hypothetical protein